MKRVDERLYPAHRVRRRAVWGTSGMYGTEHAVIDEQMTAGLVGQAGVYVTRCGERCVAASMVAPALLRWMNRLLNVPRTPVALSPHPEGGGTSAERPDGGHGGAGKGAPLRPGPAVAQCHFFK